MLLQIAYIEKNWKILVHTLTPQQKNVMNWGVYLYLNAYKVLMDPDDINENLSFRQEERSLFMDHE